MDRDEIIRIARDAKAHHSIRTIGGVKKKTAWRFGNVELERFARLIVEHEREQVKRNQK